MNDAFETGHFIGSIIGSFLLVTIVTRLLNFFLKNKFNLSIRSIISFTVCLIICIALPILSNNPDLIITYIPFLLFWLIYDLIRFRKISKEEAST